MTTLDSFFDAIAPMLRHTAEPREIERALGPSPSGRAALGFYATLTARNHAKILSDVYGPLRRLITHTHPGLWKQLPPAYTAAYPASHADPNRFAASFCEFLAERRANVPAQPQVWEELADYLYVRLQAKHAAPVPAGDDGFDTRLFVRQYSFDLPTLLRELAGDNAPAVAARPCVMLIFRHLRDHRVRTRMLDAPGLAAVARRQGPLPAQFAALPPAELAAAEAKLVKRGALLSRVGSVQP